MTTKSTRPPRGADLHPRIRVRKDESRADAEARWLRENPPARTLPHTFALPSGKLEDFSGGRVREIHRIGEYTIIEYVPDRASNVLPQKHDTRPHFTAYIGNDRRAHTFDSLDYALADIIAYKHDGLNTRAAIYFMRSIRAAR